MAEAAAIAGVAAPVVPSGGAKALPNAPKVEVSVSSLPKSVSSDEPAKPGSAKEKMFKTLRQQTGVEKASDDKAPDKKPDDRRELELEDGDSEEDDAAPAPDKHEDKPDKKSAADDDEKPAAAPVVKPDDKKKVNPWKLLEAEKKARADAEAKISEVEKRAIPESKFKETEAKIAELEKYKAELEEEIRYVNYSKHPEFKEKFEKPYQQAWSRAMEEIGELTIQEGGVERQVTTNDLLKIINLPLQEAREAANDKFGDFADDVMTYRKEIRKLSDERNNALENARKNAGEREKQMSDTAKKQHGELSENVVKTWSKANDDAKADPKYGKFFTPIEGDENVNQRLAKGFEMADRAFSESPMEPGLTSEQRDARVRRHAAVRNRSAAFGRLVYENGQLSTKIADLQKIVDEYKGSEPARDGSQPDKRDLGTGGTRKDKMFEELRKRAKQMV